jgi:3-oxoacyl-(acyl-carrier-protein) synthase
MRTDYDHVGVVLATDFGPSNAVEKYLHDLYFKGPRASSPILFSRTVATVALGDTCRYNRFKGPSSVVLGEQSACYAYDLIRERKADVVICGGVDELRQPTLEAYDMLGLLACPEDDSTAQPYRNTKQCIALGEGSAAVVMESASHAYERQARVYAEVAGYAARYCSSPTAGLSKRSPAQLRATMLAALRDASMCPQDVGAVIGCASSLPELAAAELSAVQEIAVVGNPIALTTIKGAIGETFSSSGILTLATAAVSLSVGMIPPCGPQPVEGGSVRVITKSAAPTDAKCCVANAVNICGADCSVVLRRYDQAA